MKKTLLVCSASLTIAAGCGAPVNDVETNEPIDSVEEGLGTPYRIAVLQISQTNNATKTVADFGTFPADFTRIMQNKVYASMDFFGPYHATPAQIGCNGNSNHDNPLIEAKAMAMAQAAGVWLGPYKHIWFIKDNDLWPACANGGSSGGYWFQSPGYGVNSQVGYVTNYSNNHIAMHEFEHGFYGPSLNSHLGVITCTGGTIGMYSPTCSVNTGGSPGGAPQGVWALGTSSNGTTTTTYNENPAYKVFWNAYNVLPIANLTNIPTTPGAYTVTLSPSDGPIPPSGSWMTAYLPLPSIFMTGQPRRYRYIWFEYRQHAAIGLNNEDRPGIYVYYQEDTTVSVPQGQTTQPTAAVIKFFSNSSNQSGLGPLPIVSPYVIPGEPNVVVQALSCTAATCQIKVTVSGPVL